MTDLKSRLTSRKFLLAIGVIVFAVLGYATGQMSFDAAMTAARDAAFAYIASEGFGDALSRFKTGQ